MFLLYFLVIPLSIIIGLLLGRYSLILGIILLTIAIGPVAVLLIYESFLTTTPDTSGIGILAMLCLVLAGPPGLILTMIGIIRV